MLPQELFNPIRTKDLKTLQRLWLRLKCKYQDKDYLSQLVPPWSTFAQQCQGTDCSHVFLLPWLNPGGAERGALYHIQVLAELGAKPLVILTENKTSTWLNKVPQGIKVIELGKDTADWLQEDRIELLVRILDQLKPSVIHTINSTLGWRVFKEHSKKLAKHSHLYCSVFSDVVMTNGKTWSHARRDLPYCLKDITCVMADSAKYPQQLIHDCGYSLEKFRTLYFPAIGRAQKIFDRRNSKKILWAGRLDKEKRIDLLSEIARRLREFSFDIYGYKLFEGRDPALSVLEQLPNVKFKGAYDNFEDIPLKEYLLFLFTSSNEGMPNVLLEAGLAGLPVVASDVGGVSELINTDTGYALAPTAKAEDYCAGILKVLNTPEETFSKAQKLQQLILERHSWEQFKASLLTIPGYCSTNLLKLHS